MKGRHLVVLGLVAIAGFAGCAADSGGSLPTPGGACSAGATQACTCSDGGTGSQTCTNGKFGDCVCAGMTDSGADVSDTGSKGGSAGAAGSGGAAGAGGSTKDGGTKDGGTKDGGGAVVCTTDADCQAAGACPDDATMGCGCRFNAQNEGKCSPLCSTDTDCVQKPNETIICNKDGFCAPDKGDGGTNPPQDGSTDAPPPPADGGDAPKGPTPCTTDADCTVAGVCPSDALLGCACRPKDGGQSTCAPKCTVDTDCPTSGQPQECKADDFCGPV